MCRQCLLYIALLAGLILLAFFGTGVAQAGFMIYQVNVDSSTLSGENGYLDFQFNPGGGGAEAATATISSFFQAGSLNSSDPNNSSYGDVSGSLTSTMSISNATFNDFYEAFTYGNSLSFEVKLSGAALDSPGGTYGSSFAFSLFDSTGTNPLLTTDSSNGTLLTIDVNPSGPLTTVNNYSQPVQGSPVATVSSNVSPVPEPASLVLGGMGVFSWLLAHAWTCRGSLSALLRHNRP